MWSRKFQIVSNNKSMITKNAKSYVGADFKIVSVHVQLK